MKISKLIFPFLTLAALLTSCAEEEIGASFAEVKVEPSYVSLPGEGGSKDIVLTTTDAWTITDIPEWLSVEPESGEAAPDGVTVTLTALKTYESHTAEICVNVGKSYQIVTVSQTLGSELVVTPIKEFIENGVDGRIYALKGTVKNITNTTYGNFYLNDGTTDKDAYIYGMLDASGAEKNFLSLGIEEGDEIILSGPRKVYGSDIEIVNGTLIEIVKKALLTAEKTSFTVTKKAGEVAVPVAVKGDDLTVSTPSADWIRFKGTEGSGEKTKVIMEYTENTGDKSREATFVLKTVKKADKDDEDAKDIVSELTITVMQLPEFPAAKNAADINYKGNEFATVEGQIVALSTAGVVVCDGSTNEVNKVYVEVEGFKYEDYAVGAKVKAVGTAENDYALNSIAADYFEVVEEKGEFEAPEATEVTSENSNTIINQSPAKYGFLKVSGYVSSSNNVVISGAKEVVSAVSAINSLALKNFSGQYVTVYGYNINNNTSKNQIQLVLVALQEVAEAPAFFEVPVTEEELDWNENTVEFEVIANQEWTAAITKSVEGVLISKKNGNKTSKIEVRFPGNNETYSTQEVVVTVTSDDKNANFTVKRAGKTLKAEASATMVPKKDTSIIVKIEASKYWKAEVKAALESTPETALANANGATLDKAEGMGTDAVVLSLPENNGTEPVVYTVTISEDRVDGNAYSASVSVLQYETEKLPITKATVAEFLAAALDTGDLFELTGKVANLVNTTYGNFDLVDATGSVYVYGLTATKVASNDKSFASLGIKEGDVVTLVGTRAAYKGTDQVGGPAYYVSHIGHTESTVADFLAQPVSTDKWYKLTGTIKNLQTGDYGNFDLEDETGSVYVYGLTVAPVAKNDKSFPKLGLKEGDKVTLIGTRAAYKGTDQVGGPAYYISHEAAPAEGGEGGEVTPPAEEGTTVTISFAGGDTQNKESIPFTDAASGISAVFTPGTHTTNPRWDATCVRFYGTADKSSALTISGATITKIEFGMNGSYTLEKVTPSVGSISGTTWTGNSNEIKFTTTAQTRIESVTVTYLK